MALMFLLGTHLKEGSLSAALTHFLTQRLAYYRNAKATHRSHGSLENTMDPAPLTYVSKAVVRARV